MQDDNMPIGFTMLLVQDNVALKNYTKLNKVQKSNLKTYLTSANNGNEAQKRIIQTINNLKKGLV